MSRPRHETDRLRYEIDDAMQAYSKPLVNERVFMVWLEALSRFTTAEISQALKTYVRENDYAPKPKGIIDLIERDRQRKQSFVKPKTSNAPPCDSRIAKAWHVFITQFLCGDGRLAIPDRNPDIKLSRAEVIEIVNREAIKHSNPDAIPDQYKLKHLWDKTDVIRNQELF